MENNIIIENDAGLPVEFSGILLIRNATLDDDNDDNIDRDHSIAVYKTDKGSYVVQVEYWTKWVQDTESCYTYVANSLEEVGQMLLDHDPFVSFIGYPDGDQFKQKQEELKRKIKLRWIKLRSAILTDLGITEKL